MRALLPIIAALTFVACDQSETEEKPKSPTGDPIGQASDNTTRSKLEEALLNELLGGSFSFLRSSDKVTFEAYVYELFRRDPDLAVELMDEYFAEDSSPISRDDLLRWLIETNPVVAFEFATEAYPTSERGQAQIEAFDEMINRGFLQEAMDNTERIGSLGLRRGAIGSVVRKLSIDELLDHSAWIEPMLPEEKQGIIDGLGPDWMPSLEDLTDWPLYELIGDYVRPKIVAEMGRELNQIHVADEAEAAFKEFQFRGMNDTDRALIERKWAIHLGNNNPENAVWAMNLMQYAGETLASTSIKSVVKDSPQQALEIASQFPDEYHQLAADRIISSWYRSDPYSASDYIGQMPPGPLRYHAATSLAEQLQLNNAPDDAARWLLWAEQQGKE